MRRHPCPRAEIPVSKVIYHHLLNASASSGYQKEDWEIAAEAIDEWARKHNPDGFTLTAGCSGYQWKRLFLPDGTLLRTVFNGKNYHCLVEGDSLLYEGKAVSPSTFVNAVGGTRRNAWTCCWILLPHTQEWKLADTLRTRQKPRRARALHAATASPQPDSSSPSAPSALVEPPALVEQAAPPALIEQAPPPAHTPAQERQTAIPAAGASEPPANAVSVPQSRSGAIARVEPKRPGISQQFRSAHARKRRFSPAGWFASLLWQELVPLLYQNGAINPPHLSMGAPPGA